eukprot:COSAG02_NODE_62452_length_266_cov_0.532934_1_plen_65_part_01
MLPLQGMQDRLLLLYFCHLVLRQMGLIEPPAASSRALATTSWSFVKAYIKSSAFCRVFRGFVHSS